MRRARSKRGRPPKFGRPSQMVALTLPEEVVRGLRRIDEDIAWAIVHMFEQEALPAQAGNGRQPDAELVTIGEGRSLIVVNRTVFRHLPGVHIIPLSDTRAFLALEPGRGMSDLELAVVDRLDDRSLPPRERDGLERLQSQLREWRRDPRLRFNTRAIIEVQRAVRRRRGRATKPHR
ncbi:MAG: hypothetical protein AUH43_00735 [Acidobacteria bacterium 13_1_40CM_65_14]|nr:MAG: hypothetical protein AUH43_00735 [Acidobacteria bacterium 13_1_40CM_65_14]OLC84165.1 MAG: hypothetical protein AUH72_02605 [Acidobacteria bacterium 13_1_40CM_4_65_8]OLD17700.1 MAG: hypothetical protein AUJ01_08610 [Acidobacteria bacterium 13_1_40CM_3_65_5]OLE81560.1 MAG: hypothetical protein AUF76_12675 [Acidobacteria bacterium 13_1_20CM_2_65_9]